MTIRHLALAATRAAEAPRLGLLVPATDHVSEASFRDMLTGTGVEFVANRVMLRNPITFENLSRMIGDVTRATSALLPDGRIDAIAFSCTSGFIAAGPARVASAIHAGRPGVPYTTPITAAVKSFCRLGVRRIGVLTPYLDEINEPIRAYLEREGLHVAAFASFHLQTEPQIASVPPDEIVAAVKLMDGPGIDGFFISCTGLRGHAAIEEAERATGKPVVSSNQAQLWDALSMIGYGQPIQGFGSLLRGLGEGRRAAE